jgi:cyclase
MLKKRLIGVVTVKNGWAVQSFGYKRYLPLGKPECLVENLDRWGADEILVQVIDRSINQLGPDFSMIERLGKLGLGTPLIYAGGIRSVEDGIRLIRGGADRLVVDALLHDNPSVVQSLANQLGAQALIAALPLSCCDGALLWNEYRSKSQLAMSSQAVDLISSKLISEVLIIDWMNEGNSMGFNTRLLQMLPFKKPLIAFGGISQAEKMRDLLHISEVVAVAVGNFLSYKEHAVQSRKKMLLGMPIRPPEYMKNYSLMAEAHD